MEGLSEKGGDRRDENQNERERRDGSREMLQRRVSKMDGAMRGGGGGGGGGGCVTGDGRRGGWMV